MTPPHIMDYRNHKMRNTGRSMKIAPKFIGRLRGKACSVEAGPLPCPALERGRRRSKGDGGRSGMGMIVGLRCFGWIIAAPDKPLISTSSSALRFDVTTRKHAHERADGDDATLDGIVGVEARRGI